MTLPVPDPAFRWTDEPWGVALRSDPLGQVAQHLFTSRQLPLPSVLDRAAHGPWSALASSVGVSLDKVMRVRQVHGCEVRVLRRGAIPDDAASRMPDADAVVSNEPGLALAVMAADCVPILLADRVSGATAAVHAGWRGTAARIVWAAVQAMAREFGTQPGNLTAAIGPSIGPCCYEVGEELIDRFVEAGASPRDIGRWFSRVPAGARDSLRLDVAAANRDQLVAAGLGPERISSCGLCTMTHREVFESFRAHGDRAGRMAGVVVVPERS